jgi:hypothetical protein
MMGKNLSIATICLLVLLASTVHANVFDVKTYGAQPNADITQVCIGQIGIKIFYITLLTPILIFIFHNVYRLCQTHGKMRAQQ